MAAPALARYIQGQATVSADNLNTFVQSCDTVVQLRGLVGLPGMQVFVRGRLAANDGGGGNYYWNAASTGPDNGSTIIVPTGAGTGAWIQISFLVTIPGVFNVKSYGAKVDGLTDDTAAFRTALAAVGAAGGGILIIPGLMAVASASVGASPFVLPSNITLLGYSRDMCGIKITGSSEVTCLFTSTNTVSTGFEGLNIQGNNVNSVNNTTGCWYITNTGSVAMSNFFMRNCRVQNFAKSYWVFAQIVTGTAGISDVVVDNNDWLSFSGNNPGPSSSGVSSSMFAAQGNGSANVTDVQVTANTADGSHVKTFATCWDGTVHSVIKNNYLTNFGSDSSAGHAASCLLVYDNSGLAPATRSPKDVYIEDNTLIGVFTCGVQATAAYNVQVRGGYISGQSDTTTALPYGGVAFNETSGSVEGVFFENNYIGINITAPSDVTATPVGDILIRGNRINSNVSNAVGVWLHGEPNSASPFRTLSVDGNSIVLSGSGTVGLRASGGASTALPTVLICNNVIEATGQVISLDDGVGGAISANLVRIQGNYLGGAFASAAIANGGSPSSPIELFNNTLDGASHTGNAAGLAIGGATAIVIDGMVVKNFTTGSGACMSLSGCRGSMRGVQIVNVASGNVPASTDFGLFLPTWSAEQGTFIQNLKPTGSGHLLGYTNTTAVSGTTWTEL